MLQYTVQSYKLKNPLKHQDSFTFAPCLGEFIHNEKFCPPKKNNRFQID